MSKHIVNLNVGDTLECKGPISKLPYKPNMKKRLGMVRAFFERTICRHVAQTWPQWEVVFFFACMHSQGLKSHQQMYAI